MACRSRHGLILPHYQVSRRLSIMTEPGASSGFPALDEGFADMLKEMMGANKALVEVNSQLAVASERAAGFEDKLQKVCIPLFASMPDRSRFSHA